METYHTFTPLTVGSYGQIFTAIEAASGNVVVVKKLAKGSNNLKRVENEIAAGINLRNEPGVARFHEYFESQNNFWLVFDRVQGNDLFHYMRQSEFKPMPEKLVKKILMQLVPTLIRVHSLGIYHKDIKLENIILSADKKTTTLIDFGLCHFANQQFELGKSIDFAGSKEYSSPEIISRKAYSPEKADVWSLGVTIFALLFGVFPFAIKPAQYQLIQQGQIAYPQPHFPSETAGKRSSEAIDLLKKMLALDENERISFHEMLNHSFLKKRFLGRF